MLIHLNPLQFNVLCSGFHCPLGLIELENGSAHRGEGIKVIKTKPKGADDSFHLTAHKVKLFK